MQKLVDDRRRHHLNRGPFLGAQVLQTPSDATQLESADLFQRHVLPLLIPPALLLVITAIVVTLGSALLLLSASELTIGPIVIGWPVAAAALGVLVIGFGALWLASRETLRPSDH